MSATVLAGPVPARVGPTWPRVLAADVRRLATLRSTWWFAASLVLFTVGLGSFPALGVAAGALEGTPEDVGPLGGSLSGITVAQLLVAAFAVLSVTAEYASGAVTSTLTAVPRRTTTVLARAGVVTAGVLAVSLAVLAGTFAVAQALLASGGVQLPVAPGVVRALAGAGAHLGLAATIAVALGWLLRSTAGALAVFVGIFHVLPVIGVVLPAAVARQVLPWLPGNAAGALMAPEPVPAMPHAWAALAALAGYAVAALTLAVVAVRRRDV
ncbi:MAG TPA: hypothetical protein VEV65_04015 [Kineosporiaceae bacterium]|nr:hypothetical protein [Kineosporiaceae bacterium]